MSAWRTPCAGTAWLQWQLDEQMTRAQQAAVDAGMRSGIVHDLAVGVHPEGSDAWALRDVLAQGVSVGAPPDMYNQMGQNWSQPPWRPDALAEAGFLPYRDMLRTILRHAGGIRVDHVLGLFRLWWIPEGMPAYSGTFVTSDHEALIGILALESQRAGAWLVGRGPGHGRAVGPGLPALPRCPGHDHHVVRARLRTPIRTSRCSRSSGVATAWPRSRSTTCPRRPATSPASTCASGPSSGC